MQRTISPKRNFTRIKSAEALFQILARYADDHKKAKCYWVQILAKKSFCELWSGIISGKEYSHSRVYKISGDKFYELITGQSDALVELYKSLPIAIEDYLKTIAKENPTVKNSAIDEIKSKTISTKRSILDQITFENYGYYLGFKKL